MFITIIQLTPVWVWGLLAGLVALGLSQSRQREMSLTRATILPMVMVALSLWGAYGAFGHLAVALGGWAAGVGAALAHERYVTAVRGASYVRVITAERECLVRTSLRELPQLDGQRFSQVHRGTVVPADAIATAVRDEFGKVRIASRGHPDKLVASRLYANLFRAM